MSIVTLNRFGRNRTLITVSIISLCPWIILAFASNITMLFVARFISGVCVGVTYVARPMFVAEIADQLIRGMLLCFNYMFSIVGIILIYSVGPFVSLPASSGIGALFVLIQIVFSTFLAETPYFLMQKRLEENAKKSLKFYPCSSSIERERVE